MELQIAASARSVLGKQTSRLRAAGLVPGVLFGKATGSQAVQFDAKELEALYHQAGRTSIVQVSVDGGRPTSAIIKSLTRHPLSGKLVHVDLHALDLRAEMQADIPLAFIGSAPVVEMEGAVLFTAIDHLKVKALPADLPHEISVDLSALTDMDATIHVSDLSAGDKVTILNDPDELVAKVTPPRVEEEPVAVAAEEGATPAAGEGESAEGGEGSAADEESGS